MVFTRFLCLLGIFASSHAFSLTRHLPVRPYVTRSPSFNRICYAEPLSAGSLDAEASRDSTADHPAQKTTKLWNVPNLLSLVRIGMIPVLVLTWSHPKVRAGIFAGAAITDFLDGYLARKWNQMSRFGAFLDPVADKLMVAAALVLLAAERGMAVGLLSAIILCREIGVSALREWMATGGHRDVVAVAWAGKVKTVTQLVAITVLLAIPPPHPAAVGMVMLQVATLATVWSGFGYLKAAWPLLKASA